MIWDLSDLYTSAESEVFQSDLTRLSKKVEGFLQDYGDTANLRQEPTQFHEALIQYESIQSLAHNLSVYVTLKWNVATADAKISATKEKTERYLTQLLSQLEYFALALSHLSDSELQSLLSEPKLKDYQFFLEKTRQFQPYTLSEKEEQMLTIQQQFGRQRWQEFVTRTTSQWQYDVPNASGETSSVTEDQAMDLLRKPSEVLRKAGYTAVMQKYASEASFIAYIYNTLIQEFATEAHMRGFDSTLEQQALEQELKPKQVKKLVDEVRDRFPLYQRFYSKLKERLGLDTLYSYDKSIPLGQIDEKISYPEGQAIILEMLEQFNPEFAAKSKEFFDKNWIHAEIVPGKAGGAFCAPSANTHPYILTNWTDNLYSLTVLAHELGHGLHFYETVSAKQPLFYLMPSLYLAETASTFNEYLLAEHMMANEPSAEKKAIYLNDLLQRFMNGVFRQSLVTDFELFAHEKGKEQSLSPEVLSEYWLSLSKIQSGDAIDVLDLEAGAWARIPHIFMYPFYCYNYTISNLIVLNLIHKYQSDKGLFLTQYTQFLQAGGSQPASELLGLLGIDLNHAGFYQQAFESLEGLVSQFEEIQIS